MTTNTFYGRFWQSLANKEIDFDTDAIKALVTTSAYVFDKDAHQYKSSITNEVTGTGYTAGGAAVPTPGLTYDAANDRLRFTGGNVSWTGLTVTGARQVIVYDSTPATDATRPLIMRIDFEADLNISNGTLTLNWDALGLGYVNT